MSEPDWLLWAREAQAIAQTGLAFTRDPYDRERYEQLRALAARMIAARGGLEPTAATALFAAEEGYATPKVDVRGAAFDAEGRILLVRETMDGGRWTLPGGWADVNQTASECAVREIEEETGYTARALKLALVHDRARQGTGPPGRSPSTSCSSCASSPAGRRARAWTGASAFFAEGELPADLSIGRTLPHQLTRLFAHRRDPSLATEFD